MAHSKNSLILFAVLWSLFSAFELWFFGLNLQGLSAVFFSGILLRLVQIDFAIYRLPDVYTYPLIAAGLLVNSFGLFTSFENALIGTVLGYAVLWIVYQLFLKLTGKEGLGYGDFKLLAGLGAWCGWQGLNEIILWASVCGLVFALIINAVKRKKVNLIAFGPWLALGGWLTLHFYPVWLF